MTPVTTTFTHSSEQSQRLAHDMRVRWALEEVGQPYDIRLFPFQAIKDSAHPVQSSVKSTPTYEEGNVSPFEPGATVLHIAASHSGLLPSDEGARTRAVTWLFTALNTVEPLIIELEEVSLLEHDRSLHAQLEERIRNQLESLSCRLGHADWLEGEFSVGDLMMVTVLCRLEGMDILAAYPNIDAYIVRGQARPAYRRAFEAQLAVSRELQYQSLWPVD